jgi:peroxiredoxin
MRSYFLVAATFLAGSLAIVSHADALDAGARAAEIGLNDLSGKRVDLASLKGKVVIVDFMASWCAPCKQELPVLDRLYKKYKGPGLVVIAVSVDQDLENLQALLKQLKVSFPVVHDKAHGVAGRYEPARMPSSYVVDRKGIIRHVHGGFRAEDAGKIEAEITALLAAN